MKWQWMLEGFIFVMAIVALAVLAYGIGVNVLA